MIWSASFNNPKKSHRHLGGACPERSRPPKAAAASFGVTLIELLVVFGVIAILLTLSLGLYAALRPQNDLDADTRNLEGVFRLARSNTLASKEESAFGVHLETKQAVLFKGETYNPLDVSNVIWEVSSRNEISAITLGGGGADVIFERLEGTTGQFGSVTLRSISSGDTQTLYIDSMGAVGTLAPEAIGESWLVRDSRHVPFTLGWSIKNATFLQFFFPGTGATQSVGMSPFFNVDKTDFDWSGSFSVSGASQEFRVHTHSLSDFDTVLSITRDRSNGKNTEEVTVRIVDGVTKDIASYAADGTVQALQFGGAMTIQ